MPCRFPLEAAREIGKGLKPIIYGKGRRPNPLAPGWEALDLPCGQCNGCRLEKSRIWGARIAHEAAYLEEEYGLYSSFITLTYSERYLPAYGSLVKHHLQDFLKRLRSRIAPRKIRYYAAGEYGTKCVQHEIPECPHCGPIQRPHYHAIILGFDWPDRYYVGDRDGLPIYQSDLLEDLWKFGFHEIGSCSFESAAYVARYVMKKQNGKNAEEHYMRLDPFLSEWFPVDPEFAIMSRRPGIGLDWYEKYKSDIYPEDECPIPGRGVSGKPPRYYDEKFGEIEPETLEEVKRTRIQKMADSLENGPSLESRGIVQDAKIKLLARKL